MIGEFLYQLSAKDQKSLGLEVFSRKITHAAVLQSLHCTVQVPPDRALTLQTIQMTAQPGAAQYLRFAVVKFGGFAGENVDTASPDFGLDASMKGWELNLAGYGTGSPLGDVYDSFEFDNIMIQPNKGVTVFAGFNAGANQNQMTVSFHGILIPRGNIAYGS